MLSFFERERRTSNEWRYRTDHGSNAANRIANDVQNAAEESGNGANQAMDNAIDSIKDRCDGFVEEVNQVGDCSSYRHRIRTARVYWFSAREFSVLLSSFYVELHTIQLIEQWELFF